MITHFKGARAPSLTDTIKVNGLPFDLTGSTVTFFMRPENSSTLKINGATAVITNAAQGAVRYDWAAVDVDTADTYIAWWLVTLPGGTTQPTPVFVLQMKDQDPAQIVDYINREDLKDTLTMTGGTFADKDVDRAIAAASRGIDQLCRRRFYPDPDATHIRYFTPIDSMTVYIGDLITFGQLQTDIDGDGVFETTWTLNRDFTLEPFNAPEEGFGQPYNRIRVSPRGTAYRLWPWPRSVKVTGQWGWATVPEPVKEATGLLAARLLVRVRQAPLGVVSLGVEAEATRIARSDPDVAFLLAPYMSSVLVG